MLAATVLQLSRVADAHVPAFGGPRSRAAPVDLGLKLDDAAFRGDSLKTDGDTRQHGSCWMTTGMNDYSGHIANVTVVATPQACCARCLAQQGCSFFLCVNQSSATGTACRCLLKASASGRFRWAVPSVYGGVGKPLPPLPPPPPPPPPPTPMVGYRRLGAFDEDAGESSAVVLGGKPFIMESTSSCYPNHAGRWIPEFRYCPSYLRVMDLSTGLIVANISGSCNHTFGSAMVDIVGGKETMIVFATRWARFQHPRPWCPSTLHQRTHSTSECHNATNCHIDAFTSVDTLSWATHTVVRTGFSAYNTDVVKVGALVPGVGKVSYAMAVEHEGGPVGFQSQIFITQSASPLEGWTPLRSAVVQCGCPCIRYIAATNYFYVLGPGSWTHSFQEILAYRSKDLRKWQAARRPLLAPVVNSSDTLPFDGSSIGMYKWNPDSESRFFNVSALIRKNGGSWDQSAADPDAREMVIGGKTKVLMYSTNSDQGTVGWGFGELGVFDGTLEAFLTAPFGGMPEL